MELIEIVWLSGIIIFLILLLKDMLKRNDMGPSTKAFWVFLIITLNIFGFLLYIFITKDYSKPKVLSKKVPSKSKVKKKYKSKVHKR